jgi:hypothetical protein
MPAIVKELCHPGDLIGLPHRIHDVLGVAAVTDEEEVRNLYLPASA